MDDKSIVESVEVSPNQADTNVDVDVTIDTDALADDIASAINDVLDERQELAEAEAEEVAALEAEQAEQDAQVQEDYNNQVLDSLQGINDGVIALNDAISQYSSTAYNGSISSTVLDYFDRYIVKIPLSSDYVLVRESQYLYCLYYGDLELVGTSFTGADCRVVSLNTANVSGVGYVWGVSDGDCAVDAGDYVVYSNLGDYPTLGIDSADMLFNILIVLILAVFGLASCLRYVWRFLLRRGGTA